VLVFTGFAMPSLWLALLLMDYLGVRLGLFPITGLKSIGFEYLGFFDQVWDVIQHLPRAHSSGEITVHPLISFAK
jgi:peptide/nickel transport system permease protein